VLASLGWFGWNGIGFVFEEAKGKERDGIALGISLFRI
jgi:hypothetical protein